MHRVTYANVMSTIAVFIALGGTSFAAVKLSKGSVGERELKKSAVTSEKIRDGAITPADLAPGTATSGPRGPRGAAGPAGPQGPGGPGSGAAEAWKQLTFTEGWSNYSTDVFEPGSFRKDQLGIVHLRGLVTRASGVPALRTVIGVLPAGYRPAKTRIFAVHTGEAPHQAGRVDVLPDGSVQWIAGATGETDYTSLDGISFETS